MMNDVNLRIDRTKLSNLKQDLLQNKVQNNLLVIETLERIIKINKCEHIPKEHTNSEYCNYCHELYVEESFLKSISISKQWRNICKLVNDSKIKVSLSYYISYSKLIENIKKSPQIINISRDNLNFLIIIYIDNVLSDINDDDMESYIGEATTSFLVKPVEVVGIFNKDECLYAKVLYSDEKIHIIPFENLKDNSLILYNYILSLQNK
jgi:hypothetical protein